MREKLLGMYKSFSAETDHPLSDVEFDFDFNSTDPHVYSILVETRQGFVGYWAVATFRYSDAGPARMEFHSRFSPEKALKRLIAHLESTYMREE